MAVVLEFLKAIAGPLLKGIWEFMKKYKKYWYILVIIILLGGLSYSVQNNIKYRTENIRLQNNIETVNAEFDTYKIISNKTIRYKDSVIIDRDSTLIQNAAKVRMLNYTLDEYKRFRQEDLASIASLKLKLKDIKNYFAVDFETNFDFKAPIINNRFNYNTVFYNITGTIKGDTLYQSNKAINGADGYVSNLPKIKFLWWSWGSKGKILNVAMKDPNSKITYMKYIEIDK